MAQMIGNRLEVLWHSQHATVGRIVRHFLVLFSWDMVGRLARFGTSVYLARVLGVPAFGLLAFGQALLTYATIGGDWGLGTYGAREIAGRPGNWIGLWVRLSAVRMVVGIALTAVAVALVTLSRWDILTKWVVGVTLLSAVPMSLMPDWVYRGRERMGTAGFLLSGQLVMALIGFLLFVRTPADVVAVPFVRLVTAALMAIAAQVALITSSRARLAEARGDVKLRKDDFVRLLRIGAVFLIGNLAVIAYHNIDVILLRVMRGDQIVGWYSSAYRVIWVPMAGFSALTTAAFPVLAQQWRSGHGTITRTLRPFLILSSVTGVAIALAFAGLRQQIIELLYGAAFRPATAPLGILTVVIPLEFLTALKGISYVARGLERPAIGCVVASAAVNVVANLVLIPPFGMLGAAIATVVSYAALLATFIIWFDLGRFREDTASAERLPRR